MEKLHEIALAITFRMKTPDFYGGFHLAWIFLTLFSCVAAVAFVRKDLPDGEEKRLRAVYGVSSLVLWIGEGYKQFVYTFSALPVRYSWYSFPFQFCSTPLYVFPFAFFVRKGKLFDGLTAYSATYSLLAGLLVVLFPGGVFGTNGGINVQSMLHHAVMTAAGAACACRLSRYRADRQKRSLFRAAGTFACLFAAAQVMNFALPALTGQTINMFFTSPYVTANLPVLKPLKEALPYPVFLCGYFAVFTLGAFLFFLLERTLFRPWRKKRAVRSQNG